MALVNNSPANSRYLVDSNYVVTAAVGGNVSASVGMDLVQATPYPVTEQVIVEVRNTVLSSSFGFITSSITLQHSDTNVASAYVNIPELSALTGTSTGVGIAANSRQVLLPPSVKRYVRVFESATSASAALTNVTGSITGSLLF